MLWKKFLRRPCLQEWATTTSACPSRRKRPSKGHRRLLFSDSRCCSYSDSCRTLRKLVAPVQCFAEHAHSSFRNVGRALSQADDRDSNFSADSCPDREQRL